MKGIIFNLLESTVTRQHGEDFWDTLLEETQLDGVYTALGSYPDEELMKLVGAATSVLNLPSDTFIRRITFTGVSTIIKFKPWVSDLLKTSVLGANPAR